MKCFGRGFFSALRLLALSLALVSAAPSPAHALVVSVPALEAQTMLANVHNWLMDAWIVAQKAIDYTITNWRTAIGVALGYLQQEIYLQVADTAAANERQTAEAAELMRLASERRMSQSHNPCQHIRGAKALAGEADGERMVRRAMTSMGAKPNDLGTKAKDIKTRTLLGLVPCSGGAEASVHMAYKCDQNPNPPDWGDQYERADLSAEAIFAHDQFPWPPGYLLPASGEYEGLPDSAVITDQKYMPFVAALSYCQRIRTRFTPPLQSMGDKPTVAGLAIEDYEDALAAADTAYSTCMSLVSERIMYGANVAGSNPDGALKTMHEYQAEGCVQDINSGILDGDSKDPIGGMPVYTFEGGASGNCAQDGRSALKAMKDYWYRKKSISFEIKNLGAYNESVTKTQLDKADDDGRTKYRAYIKDERALLANAIAQAQAVVIPSNSSLGTMVKQ